MRRQEDQANHSQARTLWFSYNKQSKNTYNSTYGNYMKIGIYKWAWSQNLPSDVTKRHMYYDALRIADGSGSYATVAPR